MAKKIPIRKCVGCGERKEKGELLRVVYNKDNSQVMIDPGGGKMPGRGAYLCPDSNCIDKARKSNSLARALKTSISEEIYNKLAEEIDTMRGK